MGHGANSSELGARSQGQGANSSEHGAWSMEHGARSKEQGARSKGGGAWNLDYCRCVIPGVLNLSTQKKHFPASICESSQLSSSAHCVPAHP